MSTSSSTEAAGPEMIRLLVGWYGTIRTRGGATSESVYASSPARAYMSGTILMIRASVGSQAPDGVVGWPNSDEWRGKSGENDGESEQMH
jgi:hypothetical protein